ncbi:MAG: hypothetical protein HY220_01075 [Candidatus Sungbacteria bacterium]|uniref:Uncharacterized protein n=1 Tax=Candidatus Sungiibacteriota bacterium TaxID=2750080 RepID=A0A9D6LPF0_9BACT|nr:hypothetical protein [Candidatus Sungbacteria bacterium]
MSSKIKEGVLAGLTIVASVGALFFGASHGLIYETGVLILISVLLYSCSTVLIPWSALGYAIPVIPVLVSLIWLPSQVGIAVAILAASVFAAFSWHFAKQEISIMLGTHSARILRAAIPSFLTAVSLLATVFYYVDHASPERVTLIPRTVFNLIFPYTQSLIQGALGVHFEVKANERVDDLLRQVIENESGRALVRAPRIKEQLIELGVIKAREDLSRQFGIAIAPNDSVGSLFYTIANKKADDLVRPYSRYLPIALSLGVFLTLKTASLLIYWFMIITVPGILWLARKAGVIRDISTTVTVTHYSL